VNQLISKLVILSMWIFIPDVTFSQYFSTFVLNAWSL